MKNKLTFINIIFSSALLLSMTSVTADNSVPSLLSNKKIPPRTIEWTDLMPEEDLQLIENMPKVDHSSLSKAELANDKPIANNSLKPNISPSRLESNPKNQKRTWRDALVSTAVRPEFNNINIRLAGYIVPLEYNGKKHVSTFFFVPYFGACIHVPPPPPNQIIYVHSSKGFTLKDIYTPYWITGKVKIETIKKDIGVSSYSLDADTITEYTGEE